MLTMTVVQDLSESERQLWKAFQTGLSMKFGTKADNPANGRDWGADRQVRAEVLVALLSGAAEADMVRAGVVNLYGAKIVGKISCPGAELKHQLRLTRCFVADGIELSDAMTKTIRFIGCHIGPIRLKGTRIDGTLELSGSYLNGRHGPALNGDGLVVSKTYSVTTSSGLRGRFAFSARA